MIVLSRRNWAPMMTMSRSAPGDSSSHSSTSWRLASVIAFLV